MYFRCAGFSNYNKRQEVYEFLDRLQSAYTGGINTVKDSLGDVRWEIRVMVSEHIGVCIMGYLDEKTGNYAREHYYPYLLSEELSSNIDGSIQRHAYYDVYSGILDDNMLGMSLIFVLDNNIEYLHKINHRMDTRIGATYLHAWANSGKILLPVYKTVKQTELSLAASIKRGFLIDAAKRGDELAMESLSEEDMMLYDMAARRLNSEDVYSIVDNCFIPKGVECNIYMVVGTIKHVEIETNKYTQEDVYILTIECNDIVFKVGLNVSDIQGEPKEGRRFKGRICMQGRVSFGEEL